MQLLLTQLPFALAALSDVSKRKITIFGCWIFLAQHPFPNAAAQNLGFEIANCAQTASLFDPKLAIQFWEKEVQVAQPSVGQLEKSSHVGAAS